MSRPLTGGHYWVDESQPGSYWIEERCEECGAYRRYPRNENHWPLYFSLPLEAEILYPDELN